MSWKDTNITNPGTSIKYGADDMEMVSRLFNGVTTGVAAVTIKSTNKWGFWDAILYFRNQADTKNITIRGPTNSPSTDIDLTLPPSTANDTLASIGLAQTFAQKQTFTSGAVFTQMTSPSNPGSSKHHLFVASNGHLTKRNNSGVETDYDALVAGFVDMKDGTIAARDFVRVFKVSSTYYATKPDGTVLSSGTNPATVIQAALDISPPIEVIIDTAGSGWDFLAGFTGLDVKSYNVIHLTGTSNLNMPSGYTGALFKIAGSRWNITIYTDGGYVNEVAAVSRNWTAVQIGAGDSTDSIHDIRIRGLITYTSGDVVKINQGSTGTIDTVLLDNLSTDDTRRFITWNVSDATKVKDVTVQNCAPLLDGGSVTDCFKDVKGTRTTFIANTLYGVQGSCNEMNVASGAVKTMVFGGNHTGVTGAFTDSGTDTYIDDATHTEFKLKGTPVSATISSNQNNWSPTGWDEKQNVIRITASGAARTITGLVCGVNPKNRIVRLLNVGTFDVILSTEDTLSTAANRFKFQTSITMMPNQSTTLLYDSTDSRWRALSDAMAGHAMLNMANTFLEPITIKKDASDGLYLYRPNSTNGINMDLNFDFNDSIATQVTYCDLRASIVDSTDGSEDGMFAINLINAGTKNKYFEFNNDGSLRLYNNVSTNGTNTELVFQARDSASNQQDYAKIRSEIVDNTSTSEDGRLEFLTESAGSLVEQMLLHDDGTLEVLKGRIKVVRDGTQEMLELYRTDNGNGTTMDLNFYMQDSGAAQQLYGRIFAQIDDQTAGSEDGVMNFDIVQAGSIRNTHKFWYDGTITAYNFTNSIDDGTYYEFTANDSTNAKTVYVTLQGLISDATNGSEDGYFDINMIRGGADKNIAHLDNDGNLRLVHNSNTNNDRWDIDFQALNASSAKIDYAALKAKIIDNTAGGEDGEMWITMLNESVMKDVFRMRNNGQLMIGRDSSNLHSTLITLINTTDDVRFVNSSAENTMFSFTVKGNKMTADSHLYVNAQGYILQNSATATDYTLRVKVGGTTVYQDVCASALAQSANTLAWRLNLIFFSSNQSSTTARLSGHWELNDTGTPTTGQGDITDDEIQANACFRATGISWTFANDTTVSVTIQMNQAQAATEWQMDSYDAQYSFG